MILKKKAKTVIHHPIRADKIPEELEALARQVADIRTRVFKIEGSISKVFSVPGELPHSLKHGEENERVYREIRGTASEILTKLIQLLEHEKVKSDRINFVKERENIAKDERAEKISPAEAERITHEKEVQTFQYKILILKESLLDFMSAVPIVDAKTGEQHDSISFSPEYVYANA